MKTILIRDPESVVVGAIFFGIGIGALVIGADYTMGSTVNMGSGYFPRILGGLLVGLGLIMGVAGLRADGRAVRLASPRKPLAILGSIVAFALLIEPAGLAVAVFGLVVVARCALPRPLVFSTFVLAAALALLAVVIFVYALALPIAPWPR